MISFKRMTRGIKLLAEHIFDPISSALSTLSSTGVPVAQYEKTQGTFRVNLAFPVANKFFVGATYNKTSILSVPFILPPLQDEFGANPNAITSYELVEVSVSQDTRGENASLKGADVGPPNVGTLNVEDPVGFDLSIKSRKADASTPGRFNNEVFSMQIADIALLNPYSRFNPHVQSGISVPFDHNNSYLLTIAPNKDTANLVNIFVSLKFKSKLRQRDLLGTSQNQTLLAGRGFFPETATVPAGDSTIEADTNDGVNTGFKVIDAFIDRKLRGGFNRASMPSFKEGLKDDAGYEVISVPMFGSWPHVAGGPRYASPVLGNDLPYETLPWVDSAAGRYTTMDRAIVPINYPLTIHHVIVAVNYTAGSGQSSFRPTNANAPNLKHEVGVGLMSGHRSDNIAHQQVAFVEWLPSTINNYLIDRANFDNGIVNTYSRSGYCWDLLNCPITGGTNGVGYTAQGQPMFAGQGTSYNSFRTNVGAAAPLTAGGEQVLDIRWKISNGGVNPATWGLPQSIIGYGGCWVYLICKKTVI